ncbi:MAG: nitrate reductase, partial [Gemmatimonadetes bacterium]|nr:nitrate reductase [Gemmatimonadota bacterium]
MLEHWHTGSMTRRVKQLHQAVTEGYVELNRADAQRLSIGPGEMVRVVSRRGSLELPAKVDGRGKPPQGSVFIPFFDESRLANTLTLDAM